MFPKSLYTAKQYFAGKVNFIRYVVCKKCFNIYLFKDCIEGPRSCRRSKLCCTREYPNHPHRNKRGACNSILLKTVELVGGRRILYPYLVYCYLGLEIALQQHFRNPQFETLCEKWRSRSNDGSYSDLYDGNVWKEFQVFDGAPFLSQSNNFGLIMNMDFFKPYKHVNNYSMGAIYCVLMNLPREVRYKQENLLLVGLIPGPKEPDHDINSFLNPFVDELERFWLGTEMINGNGVTKQVRCALLCVACDLPAARKTCGFLSYVAHYGCSHCFKFFPGGFGCLDYSGFDRQNWPQRNGKDHQQVGLSLQTFSSPAEREKKESSAGLRYCSLLRLPYFDAPRMTVVDPMHNLFLGTAKHFFHRFLIENGVLTNKQFDIIQNRINAIVAPPGVGRIPHKIRSAFSGFTADQWKNWTNYFSLITLHDMLDKEMFECWRHFVLASRVLCSKKLNPTQLLLADSLLLQFCRRTEHLFGKDAITPNMHMHAHLKACIEDYGPIHSFWVFAFERYNGILESLPNNNRCIEPQMMQRFIHDILTLSVSLPEEFHDILNPHLPSTHCSLSRVAGSLADTILPCSDTTSDSWDYRDTHMQLPSSRY